jgi:hypothetical protein
VFTLRQAMRYLAEHPMGKKAKPSSDAVAQLLTQLPRRQALVRSGDVVGRIHTYDTPPKLTGDELEARVRDIRDRTRAKYCHPRAEIEATFHQRIMVIPLEPSEPQAAPQLLFTPQSRWGEVDEP